MTTEDGLLATVHDLAEGLHAVGAMDDITMREMDRLCLPPLPDYTPSAVQRIRRSSRMSQPVFAKLLGVGKTAVAQWEQGERRPSGPALRLLQMLDPKQPRLPLADIRQANLEAATG